MTKARKYNSPLLDNLLGEISEKDQQRTNKKMELAAFIIEAMQAKGWKKKHLAQALGKSAPEISKFLSGTHNFTSDTLFDIGEALDMDFINTGAKPEKIVVQAIIAVKSEEFPFAPANVSGDISDYTTTVPYFENDLACCKN